MQVQYNCSRDLHLHLKPLQVLMDVLKNNTFTQMKSSQLNFKYLIMTIEKRVDFYTLVKWVFILELQMLYGLILYKHQKNFILLFPNVYILGFLKSSEAKTRIWRTCSNETLWQFKSLHLTYYTANPLKYFYFWRFAAQ